MSAQNDKDSPLSNDSSRDYFLTTLALDICRENGHCIPTGSYAGQGRMKSFLAAVNTAEHLLTAVEGRRDEQIHAYRLFNRSRGGTRKC
jgi:pyruvate-formate lyase